MQPSYHSCHRIYSMEYISNHRIQLLHIVTEDNSEKCLCGRNPDLWYEAYCKQCLYGIEKCRS